MKLKKKKQISIYLIMSLFFPFSGYALPGAQKILNIYCNSQFIHRQINYINIKRDTSLSVMIPHPAINPKKDTEIFQGKFLSQILQSEGCLLKRSVPISIIGSDFFVAEFNQEDVSNGGMFIGLDKNNDEIAFDKGGPQLIFDLKKLNMNNLEIYKRDSWWVWNIAAIIIGQPHYNLYIINEGEISQLNVHRFLHMRTFSGKLSYPLGIRRSVTPKDGVEVSSICLTNILEKSMKSITLSIHTLLGVTKEFKVSTDEVSINFQWNKKAIPIAFGGPYQVCIDSKSNQICIYYVKSIDIKK